MVSATRVLNKDIQMNMHLDVHAESRGYGISYESLQALKLKAGFHEFHKKETS